MRKWLWALVTAIALAGCGDDDDGGALTDATTPDGDTQADDGGADAGAACSANTDSADPLFAAYLDHLRERMTARRIPGLAVAILDGQGRVRHQAVLGRKAPGACGAITADTRFRLGTATLAVTGTAVVAAASAGVLGLDDALVTHVPEFTASSGDASQIRIRHLLTGTAGYPPFWDPKPCQPSDGPSEWLQNGHNNLPLWYPAGRAYNFGFYQRTLAALALERAGGARFAAIVKTRLFDRLGMTATFSRAEALRGDHALGTLNGETVYQPMTEPDCAWNHPHDQLFASLNDMIRFVGFVMKGDPAIIPPAEHAKLFAVTGSPELFPTWTTGFALTRLPYASDDTPIYYAKGTREGFAAEIDLVPDRNLAVIVLVNANADNTNELALPGVDRFAPFTSAAPVAWCMCAYAAPHGPTPVATWGEYAGVYVDNLGIPGVPPPRTFTVSFDGSKLWLSIQGATVELSPTWLVRDQDVFDFSFLGNGNTIRFTRDPTTGVPNMLGTRNWGFGPPAFRTTP